MSKYEKPFDIMALDSAYNLVAIVTYNKLQWNRKCLEPGIFSIELTVNQYNNDWCYIYSPQRRELGRISQVNLTVNKGIFTTTISGKFIEDDLNKMIVYPKPTYEYAAAKPHTSIVNGPVWLNQNNTADQVALAFFNAFKTITYMGYTIEDSTGQNLVEKQYTLDINDGIIELNNGAYLSVDHNRNGEYLGKKISDILRTSNAFYEINYDLDTNNKTFDIRHGKDLTNDNIVGNNPVVFSTQNGTIIKASLVKSNTDTKDVGLVTSELENNEVMVLINGYDEATGRFLMTDTGASLSDYPVDKNFRLAVARDIGGALSDTNDKINLSFDVFNGSYEYVTDFNIGDIVTIIIPEIDLDVDVQIIGCYEIIQNGVWSLNLEFGTPLKHRR